MQRYYLEPRHSFYGELATNNLKNFLKSLGAKNIRIVKKNKVEVWAFTCNQQVRSDIEDAISNTFLVVPN